MAHADDDEIWEAFNAVIAEEDRDSILTAMSEAAHDRRYESETVSILNRDRHDMINVTVEGIVKYKGEEFEFHLSSGDRNGTELHGWNGIGQDYEEPVIDPLSFQPLSGLLARAYERGGDPAFLLKKWDLFKQREDLSDLIRKYAYDIYMQPGIAISNHYIPKFTTMGVSIVRDSEAKETYARLKAYVESLITPLPVIVPNLPLNEF